MVTKLPPERLAEMIDGGEPFALLDTRDDESFDAWHAPDARQFEFGADEELDGRLEDLREVVGDVDRVVTICAKGISSGNLAYELERATDECDVAAVDGGMEGWSRVYDRAVIDVSSATIVQVQRRAKGCLGYVVGDPDAGAGVIVDPTADAAEFEAAAAEADLTVAGVIDTHVHADHVSGGRALADDLDVPYYLGERAAERDLAVEFTPLSRNEVLEVGSLAVKALSTPGHTTESISLLVGNEAVLTADALHVDSTGRTELEFGADESERDANGSGGDGVNEGDGEEGARLLYESLHRTLLAESEGVVVLPGHVTVESDGHFRNGEPGAPIATTVRAARTGIDVLGLEKADFVERLADPGEKPANYEEIIAINRGVEDLPPEERPELEMGPNNCSA